METEICELCVCMFWECVMRNLVCKVGTAISGELKTPSRFWQWSIVLGAYFLQLSGGDG